MRILGVDPGIRFVGIGLLEFDGRKSVLAYHETITVPAKDALPKKLLWIYQSLAAILRRERPDVVALEGFFHGRDLRAMVRVGEARACVMLAASEQGLDVVEYTPTRIKQAVTGNGQASKEQIQRMVKVLLNLEILPPADSADALAIAICHVHHYKTSDRGLRMASV